MTQITKSETKREDINTDITEVQKEEYMNDCVNKLDNSDEMEKFLERYRPSKLIK